MEGTSPFWSSHFVSTRVSLACWVAALFFWFFSSPSSSPSSLRTVTPSVMRTGEDEDKRGGCGSTRTMGDRAPETSIGGRVERSSE